MIETLIENEVTLATACLAYTIFIYWYLFKEDWFGNNED